MTENIELTSFTQLRENITGGLWNQVRLAARYAVASAGYMVHEVAESAKAVWQDKDPIVYNIEGAERHNEMLHGLGKWALEKQIIPEGPLKPRQLPHYERLV